MKTPQESEPFQTVIRIRNFVISGVTSPNNICAQKCAERMTRAMLYGYPRWRISCPWSNYLLGHDILMHIKKLMNIIFGKGLVNKSERRVYSNPKFDKTKGNQSFSRWEIPIRRGVYHSGQFFPTTSFSRIRIVCFLLKTHDRDYSKAHDP